MTIFFAIKCINRDKPFFKRFKWIIHALWRHRKDFKWDLFKLLCKGTKNSPFKDFTSKMRDQNFDWALARCHVRDILKLWNFTSFIISLSMIKNNLPAYLLPGCHHGAPPERCLLCAGEMDLRVHHLQDLADSWRPLLHRLHPQPVRHCPRQVSQLLFCHFLNSFFFCFSNYFSRKQQ